MDYAYKTDTLFEIDEKSVVSTSLRGKYVVPPFSTLDTRAGYWQTRKREWVALGIKSELGRGDDLTFNFGFFDIERYENFRKGNAEENSLKYATSIFDPVVAEIAVKWFCPEGGLVFDPFAGGSVRGVVTGMLGRKYLGIDLSKEQIAADIANEAEIDVVSYGGEKPKWVCDDSKNADNHIADGAADMILTCPPYFDLEVYSDDVRDISNMDWEGFSEAYKEILSTASRKVKDNRFAVIVVGNVRDKKGIYHDLVSLTNETMVANGFGLYNDLILVNSVGSASIRAESQFKGNRKAVKVHQYVCVYYKGDTSKIKSLWEK